MDALLERLRTFRRDLHQIPELDFDLPETTAYLREKLSALSCVLFSPDGHALCAYFDAQKPSTIAFRSDMDALPVCEKNDVPYRSRHEGKMHACGHDGHMAMLLSLAHYVDSVKDKLAKNVLLVFQPAEETTGGAKLICESGVFEKYCVEGIYGFHLWPDLPGGVIATRSGPLLARSSEITVTFEGVSAHIAKSEKGVDALLAASRFVVRADELLTLLRSQHGPWCTLKFGKLSAGTVRNAIAANARLEGSLRVFDAETFKDAVTGMQAIAGDIGKELGVKVIFHHSEGYPPVVNDAQLYQDAQKKLPQLKLLPSPQLIAEDFAFYGERLPALFMLLGTGTGIPLHADHFDFDESVLLSGVQAYRALVPLSC